MIGIALSLGGVRVLEVIFDSSNLTYRQDMLFTSLDILLNASLITGGSKGINKLTTRIENMVSAATNSTAIS